ncbi:hypothetical protein [Chitinophaga sancti]|uniref:Dolichyl-phosphate-mannose-protein mannosyltransferase n=1 Tax=Chitinophaga sancti TaxID=1004 RepID=A0A1K1T0W5_9BACT|nr:hypothetical protein [Chitinophaga sancti]WQD59568.1 hypothetical protein U0033_16870 [Chitinophaga sancti]WQG88298.1 hypothetical protein SR876_25595 [Chitinophaga sancti]SFW89975.1 hypothetical protein SAMN05661012_06534 [Chitinophaga sancti]
MNIIPNLSLKKRKERIGSSDIKYSIFAIGISAFLWILYKYYYPYPNLTFDSYHYLMNMHLNTNAAGWPVGYSKFIKIIGSHSYAANLLTGIQYFTIQLGFLFLFITFRLFFSPRKWSSLIIFIFLFINPITIFCSNHILSDSLYLGISAIWITQILWIIFRFEPYMVITQAILLLILFDLRYNSLYFPIITVFAFGVSRIKTLWKFVGIILSIFILGTFIQYTSNEMKKISGVNQYAYSNGWKQASNGLYIYEHYYKKEKTPLNGQFTELDSLVRDYFNKPHQKVSLFYPDQEITLGSFYMAVGGTPLYSYMQLKSGFKDWSLDFHRTAPYGPLYRSYGNYLILHHLTGYLKYVVFPNSLSYFTPYPEIFNKNPEAFSLWMDNIYGKVARDWYKLTTLKVTESYIHFREIILSPYPSIYTAIHLIFILTFILFIYLHGFNLMNRIQIYGIMIMAMMCLGNYIFTVLSTTSVLRYQPSIIAIEFTLAVYFIEEILRSEKKRA